MHVVLFYKIWRSWADLQPTIKLLFHYCHALTLLWALFSYCYTFLLLMFWYMVSNTLAPGSGNPVHVEGDAQSHTEGEARARDCFVYYKTMWYIRHLFVNTILRHATFIIPLTEDNSPTERWMLSDQSQFLHGVFLFKCSSILSLLWYCHVQATVFLTQKWQWRGIDHWTGLNSNKKKMFLRRMQSLRNRKNSIILQ